MATATMTENKTGLPEPTRTERVPLSKIDRDERVNRRPVDQRWVEARISVFSPAGLQVPAVSLRANGKMIVLDGQHRIALAKACGYGPDIKVSIYEGLTLVEEAGLFVLLNDDRSLRPTAKFLARVTKEDPVACAILETVHQAGWDIKDASGKGIITAVSTLERLWLADLRYHPDDAPFVVANTLQTITRAWQHAPKAGDAAIIQGIGNLYIRHGRDIDVDHMAEELAGYPGGPEGLRSNAVGRRGFDGGSVAKSVAVLVTPVYNQHLRSRKLPKYQ